MTKIAFIGLGNMGAPMATHLARRGNKVTAYDLSLASRNRVRAAGVTVADSLADAIAGASVVISMLSTNQQVQALYLGAEIGDTIKDASPSQSGSTEEAALRQGLLHTLQKGVLVIDCSTTEVNTAQTLAAQALKLGLDFVDAPVSGSIAGAKSARLTFITGGSEQAVAKAKPILLSMGNKVFHAGESGAGQAAKICNNMMLGILMSGASEVLSLGKRNGVNPAVLTDIMINSSGRNWALEVYNPYPQVLANVPANSRYGGGFSSRNMYKDLKLALQVADSSGAKVPMGECATQLYEAHVSGYGDKDFSSIMGQYEPSVLDE